jgi:hypothetical protein
MPTSTTDFAFLSYSLGNLAGNKSSSSRSVSLIVPVLGSNDDTVVADVVALMADDENLGGSDAAKGLIAVSITESDDYKGLELYFQALEVATYRR